MAPPKNETEWRALCRSGQPPAWRLLAEGSGGSVISEHGLFAAVIPAAPRRSVFNSVFYEDGAALEGSLDRLAEAYAAAGVEAWTVWVPEQDAEAARLLEAAGHSLDATPHDMGMELGELRVPDPDPELSFSERLDYERMAELNEAAYGYPAGEFAVVADSPMAGLRIYFASLDGAEVCTLGIWPHGDDAVVIWVAALPEARGRGISARLLAHALGDARDAGLATTTLQATRLGHPVYAKLGYRDFGAVQMWERRRA